jgi:23S rRNA pseudouridine2605 synthase
VLLISSPQVSLACRAALCYLSGVMTHSPVAASTAHGERIAKVLARAGLCSRRDAERWIAAGRVAVNGAVLSTPAVVVGPADRISVDGKPLPVRERTRLWLYHKPKGLVTTARDPQGRRTVFDALPQDLPRVVAVGRLDVNTEGLLLLTNDGGLARVLELPSTGWLRRYRVRAHGTLDEAALKELAAGVAIDGVLYGPVEATLDRVTGGNVWLTLGLREGKNREVKRLLAHLGLVTNRLIRVSYGPFQLGELRPGEIREVRGKVLRDQLGHKLAAAAGADFTAPLREPVRGRAPTPPNTGQRGAKHRADRRR